MADVNSGAVHVLDRMSYDLLSPAGRGEETMGRPALRIREQLPQYSDQEVDETWEELRSLQGGRPPVFQRRLPGPGGRHGTAQAGCGQGPSASMSPTTVTCAAGIVSPPTGDFGTGHRMTMDFETAKQAIDWVVKKSGKRRNIEVDFFGGEPLMAMDTVERRWSTPALWRRSMTKVFRFTITTNGMLLSDENIDYINREMSNVVLSLDGRKDVNDHMRPTAGGKGSYDVIVPKFQKLVAGRGTKDYYARGTFTRENLDFAQDVMHLASLGFRHVSVEPASGPSG